MKTLFIFIIIIVGVLIIFQIYSTLATSASNTQEYKVLKVEKQFEIRYYLVANVAKISLTATSYRDLGASGFNKLASYIFGGNSENKKIAMTSPVQMELGDSNATMTFVMPSNLKKETLPKPNNSEISIETTAAEYVAAIRFGGFSSDEKIAKYISILEEALKAEGLTYYGNFRYLGYNPPYQLFGRRNEVVVGLNESNFTTNK